jgi:hypothetical protein
MCPECEIKESAKYAEYKSLKNGRSKEGKRCCNNYVWYDRKYIVGG